MTNFCRTRLAAAVAAAAAAEAAAPVTAAANPSSMDLDLPVDPNEPTYCICDQVSYGEMVACDNPDVCTSAFLFLYSESVFMCFSHFNLTFWAYNLIKPLLHFLPVQDRVVPFWLCWCERTAKRSMVLFRLYWNAKAAERQMTSDICLSMCCTCTALMWTLMKY